jgi:hypothetical protein
MRELVDHGQNGMIGTAGEQHLLCRVGKPHRERPDAEIVQSQGGE